MTEQPRRTVATYETHRDAERAVDHLSDQGFPVVPVERVAIIGQAVRLVGQVVGRTDHGPAALHGAASGALPGALIGRLFGLADWTAAGGSPPVRSMQPSRYDVEGDEAVADEAVRLLGGLHATGTGGRPART
ncbi:general stress protein [Streptomyces sp. NPDC001046]|uniref:general stress protein n=1 Tax=unclassified Streptomyces TaxID=2593676 RepID=UPI0036ACCDD4